jgi:hypothetical protein
MTVVLLYSIFDGIIDSFTFVTSKSRIEVFARNKKGGVPFSMRHFCHFSDKLHQSM